jgi:predicted nuclease of predicted toxin-antitoxin system
MKKPLSQPPGRTKLWLDEQGPQPKVIWLRLGNCSNTALQEVLATTLLRAMDHLRGGEPWVEIRPNQQS